MIGAAFGKIVTALVDGIIMPIVGVALGGVSVSDWKYVMKPETVDAAGAKVAEVAVRYGSVHPDADRFPDHRVRDLPGGQAYNRMRKPGSGSGAAPPEDVLLLREIRDSLKR